MTTIDIADNVAAKLGAYPQDVRSWRIISHYQKEVDRGCFGLAKARNPQLALSRIIDRCIGDLRGLSHQPGREGL